MMLERDFLFADEGCIGDLRAVGVLVKDGRIFVQRERDGDEYTLPGGHAKNKTSAALAAFGLPAHEADATIRISIAPETTEDALSRAAKLIGEGVASLVRF